MLYHIDMDFGVHKSFASSIVKKVEDVIISSGKFDLPRNLPHGWKGYPKIAFLKSHFIYNTSISASEYGTL